jgi:hypothetical protein
MKDFLFLVHGKDTVTTPEELQKRMAPYVEWMQALMAKGQFKDGAPLIDDNGNMVSKTEVVSKGAFLDPKNVVSGYLIIKANDLNEASAIAKTCPLVNQFLIEVREVKVR